MIYEHLFNRVKEPVVVKAGVIGAGQFGTPIVTQAPKACKGSNLIDVGGVSLCTGRAEARRVYSYLRAPEDFASIQAMLDIICSGGPR